MSERFPNKAGGGGNSTVFIRPADLARAGFTGVVAEGEFVEALPNRFEEDKNDYKIIADAEFVVKGEDKDGKKYEKAVKPGDTLIVNTGGNLGWLMKEVSPGFLCQIVYEGKQEIASGQRKGTLAHTFKVGYGEEE